MTSNSYHSVKVRINGLERVTLEKFLSIDSDLKGGGYKTFLHQGYFLKRLNTFCFFSSLGILDTRNEQNLRLLVLKSTDEKL